MSVTFIINLRALKAVAIACSTDGYRPQLWGVNIEHNGDGLIMVATNGHRMLGVREKWKDDLIPNQFPNVSIPSRIINKIKLIRKEDYGILTLVYEPLSDGSDNPNHCNRIRLEYGEDCVEFKPNLGPYPEWRRPVPTKFSDKTSHFNPKYMADFIKAHQILTNQPRVTRVPLIRHNEYEPALVDWAPATGTMQTFGVLMPMLHANPPEAAPSWAQRPKKQ